MGRVSEIVFEAERPAELARFWTALLDGYAIRAYDRAEIDRLARLGLTPETDPTVMVDGPGPSLCFQHVPGRRYDNNRVHLDVAVADREGEMQRLVGRGGRFVRRAEGYLVLADPEGNQFCLTAADAPAG
jgi:glyoxalase superfamily protein